MQPVTVSFGNRCSFEGRAGWYDWWYEYCLARTVQENSAGRVSCTIASVPLETLCISRENLRRYMMRGGSSACGSGRDKKGRAGGLEASRLGGRTHSVAVAVAEQFPEGAPIVRGGLAHTCSSSTPLNKDGWSWAQLLIPRGAAALTPATKPRAGRHCRSPWGAAARPSRLHLSAC